MLAGLCDWQRRYSLASARNDEALLRAIGGEMFDWLAAGGALQGWLDGQERVLEIQRRVGEDDDLTDALFEAPWELLFDEGFLALDALRPFVVLRRCAQAGDLFEPQYDDLRMLFMAAAPEGQVDLDYEGEEVAILEATKGRAHVVVEESGALEFLAERLGGQDGAFEALHVSCHGAMLSPKARNGKRTGDARPVLLLELPQGGEDEVPAVGLVERCPRGLPPLVFVSACSTARRGEDKIVRSAAGYRREGLAGVEAGFAGERRDAGDGGAPGADVADPFVRDLAVRVGNVVGWDGPVYDTDASQFAEVFYGELAQGVDVPRAATKARRELLRAGSQDPQRGHHWHLARVYLGPGGGGALCRPGSSRRAAPADPGPAFLDPKREKVPVAGRETFVGRRRVIQRAIATLRAGPSGVLAHGMGNLGKSSLAARIASRLTRFRSAVVVGETHALAIFQALQRAVEDIADELSFAEGKALRDELAAMGDELNQSDERFEQVVRTLLSRTFRDKPVFLVLDDFEQALERPGSDGKAVLPKPGVLPALQALFRAFARPEVTSRLMITCRYDFAVPDGKGDLSQPFLVRLPLMPMEERERQKQWRAYARGREAETEVDKKLLERALVASGGNPGLQEVLTRPLLAGEPDKAKDAIATVEAFRESGKVPPPEMDPGDFFQRMAFEVYEGALSPSERTALGAACLFSEGVPIPRTALAAATAAAGIAEPEAALDRLLALGLLDDYGMQAGWPGMAKVPHAAVDPLARPLAAAPDEALAAKLAAAVLPALAAAWRDAEGGFPFDIRAVETTRLALDAKAPEPELLDAAATAAVIFLFRLCHNAPAAVALAEPAIERLEALGHKPSAPLLEQMINAAERIGEAALQDRLLEAALARDDIEAGHMAQLKGLKAGRLFRTGDLDAALRIHEEEELPVFEALGDRREIAIAKGKIADILLMRGDLDAALRIRKEEALPAFEALGDRRSIAVTKGRIADILEARGDLDAALRIREDEELPVYEALGDRRSIAVTKGKIADILQMRGDLDAALRIREEEELPVFEALGDRREIAITKGKIADILERRGDLDAALRIHADEVLPVYEALGERREIAIAKGKIADILAEARRPRRGAQDPRGGGTPGLRGAR